MKKEINSKSRRKWIMGGLAAFASVALLTTGFAVWVVGSSKTDDSKDVNVTVDTAQNASINFTLNVEENPSIALKEAAAVEGKIVKVAAAEASANPLQISYSQSTITYGSNYDFKFTSIVFTIAEGDGYASVKTATGASKLTGTYARTGTDFTYLTAPATIDISSLQKVESTSGNSTTITLPAGKLDFTWGTFFSAKSPANFYNDLYANETDQVALGNAADEITTELKAMYEQLNGKKIKLVATLK